MKRDIKSMLLPELQDVFKEMGEPAFRARQVFKWLHGGVRSFEEMTNLSKNLRRTLEEQFYITVPEVLRRQVSQIDGTIKYLWRLIDGNAVESVVMNYAHGNTICISSQVGCRMGCAFCASTLGGKVRDLQPSEMVDQVLFAQADSGKKISNIVLMGIGEPLDNFDNVIRFLQLINHKDGMNIGMRHISLSTCGLVEKVDKLGDYNLQLTLSVSLHAPDDETRSKIMPVNRSCGVDRLMRACSNYFKQTGRRISFEYAMIDGVNDTTRHAELLADRLAGTGSHVNLIPLNNVEESPLKPSTPENMKNFITILRNRGINVTVRRKLGGDIDASCGQLRRKVR
jgi:23S rRNA (adenine2503-C2)-methyltransferase